MREISEQGADMDIEDKRYPTVSLRDLERKE